ncbi:MAG: DNA-processing protein DprA, partial [Thermoanaerobaculia bacterium]
MPDRRDLLLAWSLLPLLTPARKRMLLARFDPPESIASADVREIRELLSIPLAEARIVRDPSTLPQLARARDAHRAGALILGDPDYPPRLGEIADPPLALFTRGDRAIASRPAIAIVGSRRASPYGINAA